MFDVSIGTQRRGSSLVGAKTCWSSSGIRDQEKSSALCKFVVYWQRAVLMCRHSHKATINACKWSPDGHLVATAGGNGQVQLFDIRTFRELDSMKGHTNEVNCKFAYRCADLVLIKRYRVAPDSPFTICHWRFRRYHQLLLPHQSRPVRTSLTTSRSA
jgi:WD40 repeat protein